MANKTTKPIKNPAKIKSFLALVGNSGDKYFALAKIQLNTGRRICDVRSKRVSDIVQPSMRFREYFVLKEKKTGKGTSIRLNEETRRVIKDYITKHTIFNLPVYIETGAEINVTE